MIHRVSKHKEDPIKKGKHGKSVFSALFSWALDPMCMLWWPRNVLYRLKKKLFSKIFFNFKILRNSSAVFCFLLNNICLSDKMTDEELVTLPNKEHRLAFC